ncbi:beta strand repeat-containing protein [Deinococcus multiflagellatus]|uniref:Beta strand repeat-containing protein n=1 Tax=Deinococcus multiflagellatus TaxID=1656887 RepID=A0ABW1ZKC0_9DEIO
MKGLFSRLSRLAVVGLGMAALGSTAQAAASYCTAVYSVQTTPAISAINPSTGAQLRSFGITGADPNAQALNPADGLLYYFDRNTNPETLYRLDPKVGAPSATAVGQMTNSFGSTLVGATFASDGTLLTYWSDATISAVNIATRTFGASRPITGSDIDAAGGTNGDISFDPSGQLWSISNTTAGASALYRLTPNGTNTAYTATKVVTISGTTSNSLNGLAIDPVTNRFYVSVSGSLYGLDNLSGGSGAATLKGSLPGVSDLASCNVVPNTPTLNKSFSPSPLQAPATTSTLTLTVGNSNLAPYYLYSDLVDTMPTGMTVNTGSLAGTCKTSVNTLTATANAITLAAGATIPVGGCTITATVNVANTPGSYTNTVSANTLQGSTGTLTTTTTATLVSNTAPTISKAFAPATVALNGTSTITFTVTNPNPSTNPALTNLNFTDTLSGMNVASTTIGGTCAATNSPALTVGATALNLTVPTLAANSSCTITVSVRGTQIGVNPNTTSGVNSTETPTRGAASNSPTLTVTPLAPVVSKSFNPASVPQGGTTQLTINVTNPNGVAATAFTLTDDIAATTGLTGLTISGVTTDTCRGAGTVTTTSGRYALTGGTLPAGVARWC